MFKHDSAFVWRPGQLYIPAMNFTGMAVGAINEGGSGNYVYGQKWEGSYTGSPSAREVSTYGFNGILMGAAGDTVVTDLAIPYDLDPQKDTYFRVVWTSGSADTADTITWSVTYLAMKPNDTQMGVPSNALDVTIAAQSVPSATVYTFGKTKWGVLRANTLNEAAEHWVLGVTLSAFAAGLTEAKFLLGLEIAYTPRRLYGGDGMLKNADFPVRTLSKQYS